MQTPPRGMHPGLALLALLAAVAESIPDTEGAERPKCGHEKRADREQERANYLTGHVAEVRRRLADALATRNRNGTVEIAASSVSALVNQLDGALAHADSLTRPPEPTQAKQAQDGRPEQVNAAEARPADPLAELPPELRRGVLTTIHALGALPLPPGAVATLTLSRTRQD